MESFLRDGRFSKKKNNCAKYWGKRRTVGLKFSGEEILYTGALREK